MARRGLTTRSAQGHVPGFFVAPLLPTVLQALSRSQQDQRLAPGRLRSSPGSIADMAGPRTAFGHPWLAPLPPGRARFYDLTYKAVTTGLVLFSAFAFYEVGRGTYFIMHSNRLHRAQEEPQVLQRSMGQPGGRGRPHRAQGGAEESWPPACPGSGATLQSFPPRARSTHPHLNDVLLLPLRRARTSPASRQLGRWRHGGHRLFRAQQPAAAGSGVRLSGEAIRLPADSHARGSSGTASREPRTVHRYVAQGWVALMPASPARSTLARALRPCQLKQRTY
jgi:hypothetical protein